MPEWSQERQMPVESFLYTELDLNLRPIQSQTHVLQNWNPHIPLELGSSDIFFIIPKRYLLAFERLKIKTYKFKKNTHVAEQLRRFRSNHLFYFFFISKRSSLVIEGLRKKSQVLKYWNLYIEAQLCDFEARYLLGRCFLITIDNNGLYI